MLKRTRPTQVLAAGVALALAVGVAGCSANGAGGEDSTIRYQTNAGLVDLPELADALGYFEHAGYRLTGHLL